jgi:hypothetical protein
MPGLTLEAGLAFAPPIFYEESHVLLSKLRNSWVISIIVGLGVGKTALLG